MIICITYHDNGKIHVVPVNRYITHLMVITGAVMAISYNVSDERNVCNNGKLSNDSLYVYQPGYQMSVLLAVTGGRF